MLKYWCFNNTFTKVILPHIDYNLKNKKTTEQIIQFKEKFNGFTEFKNCEIITNYETSIKNDYVFCNLSIRENKFKYPFSNNYIPKEYCLVNARIYLKNKSNINKNFIQEIFIVKPHYPSPFHLYVDYSLNIDNNQTVKKDYFGCLSSETLNIVFTTNQKANNLAKKVHHYLNAYPLKIE
jgi:hypothetical protein